MTVAQIVERFAEIGYDEICAEDVSLRISTLTDQFKVPVTEAENSVVSYYLRANGLERAAYYSGSGGNQMLGVGDLPKEDGVWCNIRAKVVSFFDNTSDFMSQVGMIGDETGKVKFVIWKNAGLPSVDEGKSYMFENVTTSLYEDRVSISFNKTSAITELDDDIEVRDKVAECTGVLVAIKNGSGLIKRCPDCNRALQAGTCSEHGNVDGKFDMRIMGILDDGKETMDVILDAALTAVVYGIDINVAKGMAMDAMDANVVLEDMRVKMLGKYYTVSGSLADTAIIGKFCEEVQ